MCFIISGVDAREFWWLLLGLLGLLFGTLSLVLYWLAQMGRPLRLYRHAHNPVLRPVPEHWWESEAVFNPGVVYWGGKVHLFYRAIGKDGVSRIGYAVSEDGIHFDRGSQPVYDPSADSLARAATARATKAPKLSYETLTYDTGSYGSGGGWGGSEDPRAVIIDERLYLSFTSFEGWNNERIALASLPVEFLAQQQFVWDSGAYLSAPNEVQKNWVIFPEKLNGKYAVLHRLAPTVEIAYVDSLENPGAFIKSGPPGRGPKGRWDEKMRGAGAPPIKTEAGWLVLYHATYEGKYHIGAMLLDLKNPTKILYRSAQHILAPDEWYENDWKAGVVYASGACIVGHDLFVYYGGGDKYVAAAKINLRDFLRKLTTHQHVELEQVEV
ncbi:hypothetical protein EXS62_01465 [Candidatus Kaiserbacteria bacterium]|nr:hypothetical protein [Candidatus Kaiserbacteria bacterium]